jgi:hypothetical protein
MDKWFYLGFMELLVGLGAWIELYVFIADRNRKNKRLLLSLKCVLRLQSGEMITLQEATMMTWYRSFQSAEGYSMQKDEDRREEVRMSVLRR